MTKEQFMALTIKSHGLQCYTEEVAAHFAPSENAMNFAVLQGVFKKPSPSATGSFFTDRPFVFAIYRARFLRDNTDYFERHNELVADTDVFYPPKRAFLKPFEKWLALQKHDVARVNSLYMWQQSVEDKIYALHDDIYDLEEMAQTPAVENYVAELIARKDRECAELAQLRHDLSLAIDKVKASRITQRRVA